MEMEKKNLAIIILAVVLAVSGIGNVILGIMTGFIEVEAEEQNTIVIGFASNPATIDPVDTWDVPSYQVELQSLETLVSYNLSTHPTYTIIGKLAESWEWLEGGFEKITLTVRRGVKFHDGKSLTASDVVWNFKRLMWFCNYTGELVENDTAWLAFPQSLYYFADGVTPVIKSVAATSTYNVTFELSRPFAQFLDLLTFQAGVIMSPSSTPRWAYIPLDGDIVGTGPFVYDSFEVDVEVRYHKYKNYWGEEPWADLLVFDVNEDDTSRNFDMLSLKVDYLQGALADLLETFNDSQYHTVNRFGEGLCYYYNEYYMGSPGHEGLNVTWRKALQHAVNYTYIVEEIYLGAVVRAPAAVPRAMPGHNASVTIVDIDIEFAREQMQIMGFGFDEPGHVAWDTTYPGADEGKWAGANFRTIEVNRHDGSTKNLQMNQRTAEDFHKIGVTIHETIREWDDYLDTGENRPWEMELSYIGWCPDYLDAFNMLDPLFNNASHSNFCHINDPDLQALLNLASQTADALTRQQIYMYIQSYLFDVTTADHEWKYPHAPLFTSLQTYVHSASLYGVTYNSLQILECSSMYK